MRLSHLHSLYDAVGAVFISRQSQRHYETFLSLVSWMRSLHVYSLSITMGTLMAAQSFDNPGQGESLADNGKQDHNGGDEDDGISMRKRAAVFECTR